MVLPPASIIDSSLRKQPKRLPYCFFCFFYLGRNGSLVPVPAAIRKVRSIHVWMHGSLIRELVGSSNGEDQIKFFHYVLRKVAFQELGNDEERVMRGSIVVLDLLSK